MSAAKEWEFELLKTGYLRGLLGLPLAKDDVGLARERATIWIPGGYVR